MIGVTLTIILLMNVSSVRAIQYNEQLINPTSDTSYVPGSFLFTVLFLLIGNRITRLWEIHENLSQHQHYLRVFTISIKAIILTVILIRIAEFYAHLQSLFQNHEDN